MLSILSLRNVLLNGQSIGSVAEAAYAHGRDIHESLLLALERREAEAVEVAKGAPAADLIKARTELARSEQRVRELEAIITPPTLPEYFQILPLDKQVGAATHFGVRRPPSVGGEWEFDLLAEIPGQPDKHRLVSGGHTAPADSRLTSFSELKAEFAIADITAALSKASPPDEPAEIAPTPPE